MSEPRHQHRGMSLVIVLGMIAVTMAASYALMRGQFAAVRVQRNSNRRDLARQAAVAGISAAMRRMSETAWSGVGTTFTGSITSTESFSVSYTTGDNSLTSASSDFADYPYRVTLLSTGASLDPLNLASKATHQVRAVVRLVPRRMKSAPSDLASMADYTWWQSRSDTFQVDVPIRVEGSVRTQGYVDLGSGYSWSASARDRYLQDLNQMRFNSLPDYRAFPGTLELSFDNNNASRQSWLTTLGFTLTSSAASNPSSAWTHPGNVQTYRLYPGGPLYSVPAAPAVIRNSTLEANPLTNPLGIFYRASSIEVCDNAVVQGTLISGDDVTICGASAILRPVELKPLAGATRKMFLPTAIVADDLTIDGAGTPTIDGMLAVFDQFNLNARPQNSSFLMRGTLAARKFVCVGRTEYQLSSLTWYFLFQWFSDQLSNPPETRINYFPQWLTNWGLNANPRVKFQPADSPASYAWITNGANLFVAHPSDGGLRWELVSWRDVQ